MQDRFAPNPVGIDFLPHHLDETKPLTDARGAGAPDADVEQSRIETLVIYQPSSRKFTTQKDLYQRH